MAQVNYQVKPPSTENDLDAFLGWLSTFGLVMIVLGGMMVADEWSWGRSTDTVRVVAPLLALIGGYLIGFRIPAAAPRLAMASGVVFALGCAYACHVVFDGWVGAFLMWTFVILDQVWLHRRRARHGALRPGAHRRRAEGRSR